MQTTIHNYRFDISKPDEKAQYKQMRENLKALGLNCFESYTVNRNAGHYREDWDGITITLETAHLFANQWNTAPIDNTSENGFRLFDWAQDIFPNASIKAGYWLEQTPEMREIRRNTDKCGYCGKYEPAAKGYVFCPHCLDSEHLKIEDLPLTRMVPIDRTDEPRAALTDAELAHLLPLYKEAQTVGTSERGKARLAKFRADIEAKLKRSMHKAQTEHDGFIWMLDAGLSAALVANCIYYDHKSQFCFGWRTPVSDALVSDILDVISEFPYAYEIRCADGRVLNGE